MYRYVLIVTEIYFMIIGITEVDHIGVLVNASIKLPKYVIFRQNKALGHVKMGTILLRCIQNTS